MTYYGNCLASTVQTCGNNELAANVDDQYIKIDEVDGVHYWPNISPLPAEACSYHITVEGRNYWSSDSLI